MKRSKRETVYASRYLRKNETKTEEKLWRYLSKRGMIRAKFRRQHPIDQFILDFYCPSRKLAIEIDGDIHDYQKEYDIIRQRIIEAKGIKVIRFTNNQIIYSIDSVLKSIKQNISLLHEMEKGGASEASDGMRRYER